MHRLAHMVVAAERERQVRYAARDMGVRTALADFTRGVNERDAVAIVLLDAGGDRKHVRIKDNILRGEVDFINE